MILLLLMWLMWPGQLPAVHFVGEVNNGIAKQDALKIIYYNNKEVWRCDSLMRCGGEI